MFPIRVNGDHEIIMQKQLWSPEEIALAECYWFDYDANSGIIRADVRTAAPNALHSFLKISFNSFMESPAKEMERSLVMPKVSEMYNRYFDYVDNVARETLPYFDKLMAHQTDANRLSFYKKYNFYSFEQGLGKSLTSASKSRMKGFKRTFVLCPTIGKWNFNDDLIKWGYSSNIISVLDRSKRRTIKAFPFERFLITNYQQVENYYEYICERDIEHIIIDEAQFLKNHNAKRTKAIDRLINERFPNAHISFLSGTPVKNRANDLFSYFKMIRHPLGESYAEFIRNYTIASKGRAQQIKIEGAKNESSLHLRMANFMIRKLKSECLDLPPKVFTTMRFDVDEYLDEYKKMLQEIIDTAEQGKIKNVEGHINSLNRLVAMSKIPSTIEMIDDLLDKGLKVSVFSAYTRPLDMLLEHYGKTAVKVDGSVDAKDRFDKAKLFSESEDVNLFLGNYTAAGTAINLVTCHNTIINAFPYTPTEIWQAVDRHDRIGQKNSVNVYYTVAMGTIDERLLDLITDKASEVGAIIDGKPGSNFDSIPNMLLKELLSKTPIHEGA